MHLQHTFFTMQEAREQCDALEARLQEGAAALAEAASALAARASQDSSVQVGAPGFAHVAPLHTACFRTLQ